MFISIYPSFLNFYLEYTFYIGYNKYIQKREKRGINYDIS